MGTSVDLGMAILHGVNRVLSALCHGLPLLVMPLAADQPITPCAVKSSVWPR